MLPHTIAENTVYALRNHDIPPTPRNYRLFYLHYAGTHPLLSERIEAMLSEGVRFDEAEMARLHQEFLPDEPDAEPIRKNNEDLRDIAHFIRREAAIEGHALRQFSDRLDGFTREMAAEPQPAALADLIARMRRQTEAEQERNRILEEKLAAATRQIASLEENLRTAEQLATHDALTGLLNRRRFNALVADMVRAARDGGTGFSLILADIDHFKQFNDRHGHQTGDLVLRMVARNLREAVKGRDPVCRYGGEEFAVLLAGANLNGARTVAEIIREALATRRLVNRATGQSLGHLTLSFGIAQFRPGDTDTELVARADRALYRAKKVGRNCVECETMPVYG